MIAKFWIVMLIVLIAGFLSGVGVGFMIFWIRFKPGIVNLFAANCETLDRFDTILDLWFEEAESEKEDTKENGEDEEV